MPETKSDVRILKILYRNKLKLLLITVLIGVIVAGITRLQSNIYSSTAAVSIQRPEVPITGEIPPLNTESLLALVESTWVKWELFEEIRQSGMLDKEISFSTFQRGLTTSVKRDKRYQTLIPMVKLTATTGDPELSMAIANHWAEVVLKKTRRIYQSGVDELRIFTTSIFDKVNDSLRESEESYTDMLLESNLSINKTLLEQNNQLFSGLLAETIKFKKEISTKSALLKKLKERIAELEIDGIWIGEVYAQESFEDDKYVISVSNPLASRIIQILQRHKNNKQLLTEFIVSSQIEYKEMMVKVKMKQIEEISTAIMKARISLFSSEATYSKLKEELSGINDKVVLNKAIGDDSLWDSYLQGSKVSGEELPLLKTEISNIVYEGVRQSVVNLSATINGLRSQISEGKKEREKLQKELSELKMGIFLLNNKKGIFVSAIRRDREILTYYEKAYNENRQIYEVREKELVELEVKLESKESKLKSVKEKISRLEKSVFTAESKIVQLKRDVDNLIQVRTSLAVKAEEVALLKVSMENVSRSGTVLLYQAQADPIKVGPHRVRVILAVMLLTFLVASTVLVVNVLLREE